MERGREEGGEGKGRRRPTPKKNVTGSVFLPTSEIVNVPIFRPSDGLEVGQKIVRKIIKTFRLRVIEFGSGMISIRRGEKSWFFAGKR